MKNFKEINEVIVDASQRRVGNVDVKHYSIVCHLSSSIPTPSIVGSLDRNDDEGANEFS